MACSYSRCPNCDRQGLYRPASTKGMNDYHYYCRYCQYMAYYRNNVLHRDYGPAERSDRVERYFINGRIHNDDGPAVSVQGYKEWCRDGVTHRLSGPARVWKSDVIDEEWWVDGQRHREDGPAVIIRSSYRTHFLTNFSSYVGRKTEWKGSPECNWDGHAPYKAWYRHDALHREDGPAVEFDNGTQAWYVNGLLHRDGAPAIIWNTGVEEWFLNGLYNRADDGPTCSGPGGKVWHLDGRRHRVEGPAVEWRSGDVEWWLNGERFSEQEHHRVAALYGLAAIKSVV